ncbi:unnamed protein product [Prunus brigantina]
MPTQGKPRHAKLPIASLSRNALNGAMPSQGTTCQGKARHARQAKGNASQGNQGTHAKAKPRPCRAKLPIASLSRNSLIGAMPLPRPRHAKARHANATQSKAMPTQGMPRRRHDMARQGKAKARPRQGKPKPRQAKANARQGKPNAWQGKHVKIQSVGWVASPSFGGKVEWKRRGRDESKRRRAESQWILVRREGFTNDTCLWGPRAPTEGRQTGGGRMRRF